jgi:2'-5' RNA ligase
MDTPRTFARCALVARVPRPIEVQIEDAFLNLPGITRPSMGFHITLVGPFRWAEEVPPRLLTRLARLCRRTVPLELAIAGPGTFSGDDSNAVYMGVDHTEALCTLQARVFCLLRPYTLLQREPDPHGYVPHITLGLGLTPEERDHAFAGLEDRHLGASFAISELHLVEELPGSPWRVVRTLPLAGQAPPESHSIN